MKEVWNLEKASIWAKDKLQQADIKTFNLDVDVLLAHVIKQPRYFVHTYPDHKISLKLMRVFKKKHFEESKSRTYKLYS